LKKQQSVTIGVDTKLFQEQAEKDLYQKLTSVQKIALPHFDGGEYLPGLNSLAALRPAVDQFFDDVMVMADDEKLKLNRLALLQALANSFLRVADFSRIQSK